MLARRLLSQVFDDHALTRGLGDAEARILVEWLVERAERLADKGIEEDAAHCVLASDRLRARVFSRFVSTWCYYRDRGAAGQLAATERLNWPLPDADVDPCELMQVILDWEDQQAQLAGASARSAPSAIRFRSAA